MTRSATGLTVLACLPGYWVVFSGTFANEGEAAARAARAGELGYADAYPRFVSP